MERYKMLGRKAGIAVVSVALGFFVPELFCLPEAVVVAQSQSAEDLMAEGDRLLQEGIESSQLEQMRIASTLWEQALEIYRAPSVRDAFPVESYRREANVLIRLGDIHSTLRFHTLAMTYYEQAISLYQLIEDYQAEANTFLTIGDIRSSFRDYQSAVEYYEEALALYQLTEDQQAELITLRNLGSTHRHLGNYQRSIDYYEQALTLYQFIEDQQAEADMLNAIGNVYSSAQDYQNAIEYYEQALALYQLIDEDRQSEIIVLRNLANVYKQLDDYQSSITHYEQALNISLLTTESEIIHESLDKLRDLYRSLNNELGVIPYYEQVAEFYEISGNDQEQANILNNLGSIYHSLDHFQDAIIYYDQALQIYQAIEHFEETINVLNNLRRTYDDLGEIYDVVPYYEQVFQARLERLQESLDTIIPQGNIIEVAHILTERGDTLYRQGETYTQFDCTDDNSEQDCIDYSIEITQSYLESLDPYQEALQLYRESDSPRHEIDILDRIGNTYSAINNHGIAIYYYDQVLQISQTIEDDEAENTALINLRYAYEALGNVRDVIPYYEQIFQNRLENLQESLSLTSQNGSFEFAQAELLIDIGNLLRQQGDMYARYECVDISDTSGRRRSIRFDCVNYSEEKPQYYTESIESYQEALRIYEESDNYIARLQIIENITSIYFFRLHDFQNVQNLFQQELDYSRSIGSEEYELSLLNLMDRIIPDIDSAVTGYFELFGSVSPYRLHFPNPVYQNLSLLEASRYYSIFPDHIWIPSWQDVIEMNEIALFVSQETNDLGTQYTNLRSIGWANRNLGNYAEALDVYEQALEISRQTEASGSEAAMLWEIAIVYIDLAQYENALLLLHQLEREGVWNSTALNYIGLIDCN